MVDQSPTDNSSEKPKEAQVPAHIGVLQSINQLCVFWAQSQACRVQVKPVMVMVEPIPGRPGVARPTGDMVMTFEFKMPPKVLGG